METELYYKALRQALASSIPSVPKFLVPLTPMLIANMLESTCNPSTHLVVGVEAWLTMLGDPMLTDLLDPETKLRNVGCGAVATLLGTWVITDAYAPPAERVFNPNLVAVASTSSQEVQGAAHLQIIEVVALHCCLASPQWGAASTHQKTVNT